MTRPRPGAGDRTGAGGAFHNREDIDMEYVKIGVHIWVSVLIMGTVWRLLTYHALASNNAVVNHAGKAMAVQY
jgi:hypothetical protein